MAAFTDAAARSAGGSGGDSTAGDARQRLLPSTNGDIEMASAPTSGAFGGGGASRRRAHVLERLQTLNPHHRGGIDKEQLVGAQVVACCRATCTEPSP